MNKTHHTWGLEARATLARCKENYGGLALGDPLAGPIGHPALYGAPHCCILCNITMSLGYLHAASNMKNSH